MENTRVLYDAFNLYYQKGLTAVKDKKIDPACRNFYLASEVLLKLAKYSEGSLKQQRVKRAEELMNLATEIEKKKKDGENLKFLYSNNIKQPDKSFQESMENEVESVENSDIPSILLDDVAGLDEVKEEIRKQIIEPRNYPEVYKKFKKKLGGGILLYGLPGTGKTMIAQAIANEIDAKFFSIKCSDIVSKYFGDSEQKIKNLFQEARKHPCSIIFFDEFESIGTKRDTNSSVMKRIVPELLMQMQGFDQNKNTTLLLIAATNRPWDIDTAFLRPGRFSTSIHVPLPDRQSRQAIIEKKLSGIDLSNDVDINEIVEKTEGFNGADIADNLCEKIKENAIQRTIESGAYSVITREDIINTLKKIKTSVHREDVIKMEEYEEENRN